MSETSGSSSASSSWKLIDSSDSEASDIEFGKETTAPVACSESTHGSATSEHDGGNDTTESGRDGSDMVSLVRLHVCVAIYMLITCVNDITMTSVAASTLAGPVTT